MKLLFFVVLFFSAPVIGQTVFKEALPIRNSQTSLDLKLFQESYLSDTGDISSSFNSLQIGIKRFSPNGLNAKGNLLYSFSESNEPYLDIQDFNIPFEPIHSRLKTYLGRKTIDWSAMDNYWGLGAWEPTVAQNSLEPHRQGLTGLFVDLRLSSKINLVLFGSSVSIPSVGPKFSYRDRKIKSKNPWFHQLVDSVEFPAADGDLLYDLNIPPYEEIFIQNSYGAKLEHNSLNGDWVRFSAAHKPINQFVYQAYNSEFASELGSSIVSLRPTVFYHNIYSLEAGKKSKKINTWISYSLDKPIITKESIENNLEYIDPLKNSQFYSAYFGFSLSNSKILYLSYMLREDGKNLTDFVDGKSQGFETLTSQDQTRYFYSELIKVGYKFNVGRAILNLSYAYSQKDAGDIFKAKANYFFNSGISAFADLAVLSSFNTDSQNFFGKNKSNDYLKVGVEYVF